MTKLYLVGFSEVYLMMAFPGSVMIIPITFVLSVIFMALYIRRHCV